jgi:hypothetical protein
MAITRAQIPEQIDVFQEGGGATSITPEDILAIYGQLESQPVTPQDIQAQADMMSGLFPQPRKSNIYDLASAVGAGMVAGASDPGGFGVGLTAGLQSFNERAEKIKAEKDKMRQELAMLAYQQVEAKRKEQLEMSKEILEMQFEAALEGAGGADFGSSTLGKALAYIVRAEKNPALKDQPEYAVAVAIAKQEKTSVIQTEEGAQTVKIPGIDIDRIFENKGVQQPPPSTITIGGKVYTSAGRKDAKGGNIYTDPDGNEVVIE